MLLAVSATVHTAPARADVLEVGAQGYDWIAGGPALDDAGDAALATAGSPVSVNPRSVTQVTTSAGPSAWRARIAQLAAKYDLSPALLEAVVWQESRWNDDAVSPVGAQGLAQLMPGTARMMGVNPQDPSANLEGGARYLRLQLDRFDGNIEKALAAYNAGPGRVIEAGGVPRIAETQAYVAAIMARLSAPVRK